MLTGNYRKAAAVVGLAAIVLLVCRLPASEAPLAAAPAKAGGDGQALYEQHCLSCHGTDARGSGKYPSLVGSPKAKNYERAYTYISRNMPQNDPGSLKEDEVQAIAKYVLSLNGVATDFSDIGGHWAEEAIQRLYDKKYVDGYLQKDGKLLFKPDRNITRAEFVRYLVKARELFLSNADETGLTDISSLKGDKVYIVTAIENGLVQGYPDHTFKPANSISRAEIAALLARSELLQAAGPAPFSDVPAGHWANAAIHSACGAGWFVGYEDGTFHPDNPMTRGEAAAVIARFIVTEP